MSALMLLQTKPQTAPGEGRTVMVGLLNHQQDLKQRGREGERRRPRKSRFWFALYFFVRVIRVLFLCFKFCEQKNDGMFLHEAKQLLRKFSLLRPRTLEKKRSFHILRCNFSDNYVQVLSSMHSNVQLLYLLFFFAVFVGVAVLVA